MKAQIFHEISFDLKGHRKFTFSINFFLNIFLFINSNLIKTKNEFTDIIKVLILFKNKLKGKQNSF